MVVEPLGSVMTVQAQGSVPAKETVTIKEGTDAAGAAVQEVAKVDKTTNVVEDTRRKDNAAYGENKEQTPAQTQEQQKEQIQKAVEKLNKSMSHSEAVFGIHEETNRVTIKIVDRDTREVIKEIPPEKTLDMIAKVWELAGILIDEKR